MTTDPTKLTPASPSGCAHRTSDLNDLARRAVARLCAEMHAHAATTPAQAVLGDPCAAAMAYALCDEDDAAATALVDDLLRAGLSVEDLCLDHLGPAARHLGELWDRDRIPFTEVALATARIQALLRRMPPTRSAPPPSHSKSAIFAAVPGEQHTLGVMMAADLFRRNGWDVGLMVGLGHDELVSKIARDDRPVIGLSCSGSHSYPSLRRLLSVLARTRPSAHILLSGQVVGDAGRIGDLPVPVAVVTDIATAEAEMLRIETLLARPRARTPGRRSISAA